MEGVEDIPGPVLEAGLRWDWESFGEYLDALDRTPRTVDIAAQLPHGAVRSYVMGARAVDEVATDADRRAMFELVRDGLRAGAVGFTTSRTPVHRSADGNPVPGTTAEEAELLVIGAALRDVGVGVFGVATGFADEAAEFAVDDRTVDDVGAAGDVRGRPGQRRHEGLATAAARRGAGERRRRAPGPADRGPADRDPDGARVDRAPVLPQPGLRRDRRPAARGPGRADAGPRDAPPHPRRTAAAPGLCRTSTPPRSTGLFPLGDPPDYEPGPERSVAAIAARRGEPANSVAYDLLLGNGGHDLLYFPLLGYADGDCNAIRTMLEDPNALLGLGDGGAHSDSICDGAMPTFMLTHWARDRDRGAAIPRRAGVSIQTRPGRAVRLRRPGPAGPGTLADINVIDFDALQLRPPEMVHDLPAGGRRLIQRAVRLPRHRPRRHPHLRARRAHGYPPRSRPPLTAQFLERQMSTV